jgi:hypothetical protein
LLRELIPSLDADKIATVDYPIDPRDKGNPNSKYFPKAPQRYALFEYDPKADGKGREYR